MDALSSIVGGLDGVPICDSIPTTFTPAKRYFLPLHTRRFSSVVGGHQGKEAFLQQNPKCADCASGGNTRLVILCARGEGVRLHANSILEHVSRNPRVNYYT